MKWLHRLVTCRRRGHQWARTYVWTDGAENWVCFRCGKREFREVPR